MAAGPIGRHAEAAITPVAAVYPYSRTQGLFAGVSLGGTVVGTRNDANAEYYGRRVTPEEILSGYENPKFYSTKRGAAASFSLMPYAYALYISSRRRVL